jgi:predicted Zn-dependent protease
LRKKLEADPDNISFNRWLIENEQTAVGSLAGEYRKKLDEHPGKALYLYLYGRALMGANTPEAIRQLNLATNADPKLP